MKIHTFSDFVALEGGILLCIIFSAALLAIAAFSLSSFGISGALPVFWNLPTAYLGAAAAAGGIAFINSVGNISGYASPQMVGLLRDTTGSYEIPMLVVGGLVFLSGLLVPVAARAAGLHRTWRLGTRTT